MDCATATLSRCKNQGVHFSLDASCMENSKLIYIIFFTNIFKGNRLHSDNKLMDGKLLEIHFI